MKDNIIYLAERKPFKKIQRQSPLHKLAFSFDKLSKTDQQTLMILLDAFLVKVAYPSDSNEKFI